MEAEQGPAGLPPADPRKAGLQLPKLRMDTVNHRNHEKSQGFPRSPISISCCLVWHSSVPVVGLPLMQGQEKDLPINRGTSADRAGLHRNGSKPEMGNDSSSEGWATPAKLGPKPGSISPLRHCKIMNFLVFHCLSQMSHEVSGLRQKTRRAPVKVSSPSDRMQICTAVPKHFTPEGYQSGG